MDDIFDAKKRRRPRRSGAAKAVKATGTRAQVMHGTARKTKGGLTKADLKYNKDGRIVSRVKSRSAGHLSAWNKAAKAEGYMKKGQAFKPLPRAGTAAYARIQARAAGY